MGVSGVFGLVNTSLIIRHFGADAFAQYGLLATFPTLMPFTDLGIGAVILNTVASSNDPAHDSTVRRTITTAVRVLLGSALVISTVGVVILLLGAWPGLLGGKLMEGGGLTATVCLIIYAAALPLSVGQRVIIGLGRSTTQVISQGVVSPAMSCFLLLAIVTGLGRGNAVSIYSYIANALVSVICIVVAWRATRPLFKGALRDVPRLRSGSTSSTTQTQRSALSPGTRDSRTIPRTSKPVCFGKPTPCIRSFPERYIRSMALTPLETVSTITSPGFGFRTATSSVSRTEGSP